MRAQFGLMAGTSALLLAAVCSGQTSTTLYLVRNVDLDPLCTAETSPGVPIASNAIWIGHAPTAIAYGRGSLFVGGMLDGGALPLDGADADGDLKTAETTPFNVSIVRIGSILITPAFSPIAASRRWVPADELGYTGLDYAPNNGATVRGLIAAYDTGGSGPDLLSRYDVDAPAAPLVAPIPSLFTGFRLGSSGPAWDFGPAGLGVDYAPSGALDGVPDGPVVACIESIGTNPYGPYGVHPATLNAGLGSTLYEIGINNGPRLAPSGEGNRTWRDMSIDRRNGGIAARAENTLLFCTRSANGTATRVDLAPADPSTERVVTTVAAAVNNQHVSIMTGYDPAGVGDLLVWNDRPSTGDGQPLAGAIRFNKTNRADPSSSGAAVSATYLNADGSPASFPSGTGLYDFFWDQATRILFVCDGANRSVYLFSAEQPRACCLPSGVCLLLNPSACGVAEVGGESGAAGPSCSPNPCAHATGACCNGAACSTSTPGACTGTFMGSGTACQFAGNPVTCCRANFNQTGGVSVQDIFDFLGAFFGNSAAADVNGSGGVTVQDLFDYLALYFQGCPG